MKPYKTITLRLNAREYAHLREQADTTGLKMEPLIRQLIMGIELRPRPPRHLRRPSQRIVRYRQQCEPAGPSGKRQG